MKASAASTLSSKLTTQVFSLLLGQRLARQRGELTVACNRPIRIRRDAFGVAYVDAQSENDAWFGLGFSQGQDRAGQLELSLRLVRGTLSEVIGRDGLHVDRATRLIGVHHAATRQYARFAPDLRVQLGSFCEGLNAALTHPSTKPSHEHALLRTRPSRWEPEDAVALGLMMCCLLPSNWDAELARLLILSEDGEAAVSALDPAYRPDLPVTSPPGASAGTSPPFIARDLEALREFVGRSGGSNAWAVAAHKTERGNTLLANDPHLPAALPNLGYLTRVSCPEFRVAGISIVGIPAFITGHNEHAAWGSTSAQIDNTDLFLEELGADGRSVREGSAFVPCDVRDEAIPVRGQSAVPLRIVTTKRGPVVAQRSEPETAIFAPLPLPPAGRANAISFAATWLGERPTRALLSFHRVKSFAEFRELNAEAAGCAYSMIYADRTTIGWSLAGEVPVRRHGFGSLPMPGWREGAGWEPDVIASSRLPHAENPSSGYVCCANNQPVPSAEPGPFLGHDFLDGYRQQRISRSLAARNDWTVARMGELHLDVVTLTWEEVRDVVLGLPTADARTRRALELLRGWDGRLSADSAAASVYELFFAEVCQRACRRLAPRSWQTATGKGVMRLIADTTFNARRASFVARLVRDQPAGYFDSWPDELAQALAAAVATLEREFGSDAAGWTWGEVRPLTLRHRFGEKKPLDRIFNRGPLPGYGDGTTVNQAGFAYWKPLGQPMVTAHLRAVMEVGDWSRSRFVLLGGQSGNPLSPHYADLIPLWQRGEGVPIHWEDDAVSREAKHELRLIPVRAAQSR